MAQEFYNANLGFILEYTDGKKNQEIEYEIYKIIFQVKGLKHYDRANGGSFENIEQEISNPTQLLFFIKNILESIYRANAKKNYDPYIIVSYRDIDLDDTEGKYIIRVKYSLLQDLAKKGDIEANFNE